MGWARTLLLGDIGNRLDIADNEERVSRLRSDLHSKRRKDASQDAAIDRLVSENDQLKLAVAGLVRLLVDKGVASEAEIESLVRQMDETEDASEQARPAAPRRSRTRRPR